jgi:hypothetical protein
MANDDLKQKVFILNIMATPLRNSFLKLITLDQQKETYILQFASFTMGEWFDPPLRKEFGLIIIHIYINHKTLCAQVFYICSAGKIVCWKSENPPGFNSLLPGKRVLKINPRGGKY